MKIPGLYFFRSKGSHLIASVVRAVASFGNLSFKSNMEDFSRSYFSFTKQDIWILYLVVPPQVITYNYLSLGESYLRFPVILWATMLSLIVGTCFWATHIIAANIIKNAMPGDAQPAKRILILIPIYISITILFGLTNFAVLSLFKFVGQPLTWPLFWAIFMAGLIANVVATSFHEGLFAFSKWRASALEAEQLKKNYVQSQLDGLKSQVNPHFLFNSLNSLSALIYSDKEKAGEFLDEMSKVYRYLLRSNENELIPLSAEIRFAHSFFHMLKTRYNEGIALNLNIQARHLDFLIPPLTLQLLIENAVKHNVISKNRPLCITIFTDEQDILTISNNVQKKATKVLSNGVGLQNIITKYRLLNHSDINIKSDDVSFIVQLPLFNHT